MDFVGCEHITAEQFDGSDEMVNKYGMQEYQHLQGIVGGWMLTMNQRILYGQNPWIITHSSGDIEIMPVYKFEERYRQDYMPV